MPVSQVTGTNGAIVLTAATYAPSVTVDMGATVYGNANGTGPGADGFYAATGWTVENYGSIGSQYDVGINSPAAAPSRTNPAARSADTPTASMSRAVRERWKMPARSSAGVTASS